MRVHRGPAIHDAVAAPGTAGRMSDSGAVLRHTTIRRMVAPSQATGAGCGSAPDPHRSDNGCAPSRDLAPAEAAVQLRCSRTLVYRLIERGELPGTYELPGSNRKRIPRADLDALKKRHRVRREASPPMYEPDLGSAKRPRSEGFAAELAALERGALA